MWGVLCLLMLLWGCNNSNESKGVDDCEVISVGEAFENKSEVCLGEYVCTIDYIPLETAPECMLLGEDYLQLRAFDGRIYIYNRLQALQQLNTLPLYFNADGSFVSTVGAIGNSYNEFLNIQGVFINEKTKELIIADVNKFLFYTLDGEFKRVVDVISNCSKFVGFFCDENSYVYLKKPSYYDDNGGKDFLIKVDSLGCVKSKVILNRSKERITDIGGVAANITYGSALFHSSGNLYLNLHNDTLYNVNYNDMSLTANFFFDFGKYTASEQGRAMLFEQRNPFFVTSDFVVFTVLFSRFQNFEQKYRSSNFIYDRKKGTTRALEYNDDYGYAGFTNDIDGGMLFYPKYMNEGKMYQLVDAIDFIEYAQKSNSQKMKEVAATLTEESNPVMVVATLK